MWLAAVVLESTDTKHSCYAGGSIGQHSSWFSINVPLQPFFSLFAFRSAVSLYFRTWFSNWNKFKTIKTFLLCVVVKHWNFVETVSVD